MSNAALPIGTIRNANWDQQTELIRSDINSCDECICDMLMPTLNVLGLNCFWANRTCHLFINNYSTISTTMRYNPDSTFYFLVLPTWNAKSIATTATTQPEITTSDGAFTKIFWALDNNTRDLYNVYNGENVNDASYSFPGITGYGSALSLHLSLSQYVNIISPPLDLAYSSFTFELWINLRSTSPSVYFGAIGQCTSYTPNMCIHIGFCYEQPYLGFYFNDCLGNTKLNVSTWYHLAYIYSYESREQSIYLNGIRDCHRTSVDPYQGSSEKPLTIGMILPFDTIPYYFDGMIDQVSYINRAKSDTEILYDATVVVQYSFDSNLLDSGPLAINGTGVDLSFVNATLAFTLSTSYFRATGFTLLSTSNLSYSISLWIYPYSTMGGSLVYLWNSTWNSWCLPLLGLSITGSVIAQQYNGSHVISISSEQVPNASWTHVVSTYSINAGIRLYINGTLVNTSIPFPYSAISQPGSITLGQSSPVSGCSCSRI